MIIKITATRCYIALSLAIFHTNAMLQTTVPKHTPMQSTITIRGTCLTERQAQSTLNLIEQIITCLNMPIECFGDYTDLSLAHAHQNECVAPYYESLKNLFKLDNNANKPLGILQMLQKELQCALNYQD